MSGDAQPRKRKNKGKKKGDQHVQKADEFLKERSGFRKLEDSTEEDIFSNLKNSTDEIIHVQKDIICGGNVVTKLIFFGILASIGVMVGVILLEYRGSTDDDTSSALDSPWSITLENWVDTNGDVHAHDQEHDHDDNDHDHDEHEEERHDQVGDHGESHGMFSWFNFGGQDNKEEADSDTDSIPESILNIFSLGREEENTNAEAKDDSAETSSWFGFSGSEDNDVSGGWFGFWGVEKSENLDEAEEQVHSDVEQEEEESEEEDETLREEDEEESEEQEEEEDDIAKIYMTNKGKIDDLSEEEDEEDMYNVSEPEDEIDNDPQSEEDEVDNDDQLEEDEDQGIDSEEEKEKEEEEEWIATGDEEEEEDKLDVDRTPESEEDDENGDDGGEEEDDEKDEDLLPNNVPDEDDVTEKSIEELFPEAVEALRQEAEELAAQQAAESKAEEEEQAEKNDKSQDIDSGNESLEDNETEGTGEDSVDPLAEIPATTEWKEAAYVEPIVSAPLSKPESVPPRIDEAAPSKASSPSEPAVLPIITPSPKAEEEAAEESPVEEDGDAGEEGAEAEGEEEEEEGSEDLEIDKDKFRELIAKYGQDTPESSEAEQSDDDIQKVEYSGEEESADEEGAEESPAEVVSDEEQAASEDELKEWTGIKKSDIEKITKLDSETESEVEEESEDEAPPPPSPQPSRLRGGPNDFFDEDYQNAYITNEEDWAIREELDRADEEFNYEELYF